MKENENWIVWNPSNIEEGPAFSVDVIQSDEITKFSIDCESRIIDILFCGLVPMYTYSIEGIRTLTWATVQEKKMDRFFFRKWFLYKIENSDYLDWALKESCGYYTEMELTHYCIVTEQEVVDILAMCEPEIVVNLAGAFVAEILFDRINNTLLNSWQGMGANAYRSETAHILEKIGGIEDVLKSINESVIKDIRNAYNNLDNKLGEFNANPGSSDAKQE